MIDRVQMVTLTGSVALLLLVLELVRRRKLTEEYSLLWILASLGLLAVALLYPPIVLVVFLLGVVFVVALCFSVIVSRQRQQIERLIEETAILAAEMRDVRAAQSAPDAEALEGQPASRSAPSRPAK
jgi:predicted membrane protein